MAVALFCLGLGWRADAAHAEASKTASAECDLLEYNPYESVDWSNEQGYYAFHVHIRKDGKGVSERLYEETGHRGALVGDAWCRSDREQVHGYWPWVCQETGDTHTGELLDRHHQQGMVAIPGGEYDGGGLQHHVGINTQYAPDCGNEDEASMQAGIIANPEVGDTSVVYLTHYTGDVESIRQWHRANELLVGMDTLHLDRVDRYADVYHAVLDSGLTRWWQFASDDYSYQRAGFHQSRDVNRNYFILEEHSVEQVVQAIVEGAFYITQSPDDDDSGENRNLPPEIQSIKVDRTNKQIAIESEDAESIQWIHRGGEVLTTGDTLNYEEHWDELQGGWVYARILSETGRAHTQPWSFSTQDEPPR